MTQQERHIEEIREELKYRVEGYIEKLEALAEKDDWDARSEFFEDVCDFNFIIDRFGRLKDVVIYLGIGGPTYYINTEICSVVGCWAGISFKERLNIDTVNKILDYWEEEYECIKNCNNLRYAN